MYTLKSIYPLLIDNIDAMLNKRILENKKVYIFGANLISEQSIYYLWDKGYEIEEVIDNSTSKIVMIKNGEQSLFCGKYSLCKPSTIEVEKDIVILVGIHDYAAACSQLVRLGFDDKQIFNLVDYTTILEEDKVENVDFITQEEVKKYQMKTLRYVKKVCSENKLRFYLCGGTLLGAVRHKGYIPWDDDIDVFMPAEDMLKFIDIVKNSYEYETETFMNDGISYLCLKLVNTDTVLEEIYYPFIVKSGISIDIFPLSGFPTDKKEQAVFKSEIWRFRADFDKYYLKKSIEYSIDGLEELQMRYRSILSRYSYNDSLYVGYIMTGRFDKEILNRKCFDRTLYATFEKEKYPIFNGYDTYLKNMYGDYMLLPPANQRVNKHAFRAWRLKR